MIKFVKNDFFIYCKEARIESPRNFYGSFSLGPFEAGQSITIANALRRTLLSELKGLAITSAEIEGAFHEYSTLPGIRDSILDILLNLKDIILKSVNYGNQKKNGITPYATFKKEQTGYLKMKGPGIVTALDLKLPPGIQCVDPDQYIATLSEEGCLTIKFTIHEGKNYHLKKKIQKTLLQKKDFSYNGRRAPWPTLPVRRVGPLPHKREDTQILAAKQGQSTLRPPVVYNPKEPLVLSSSERSTPLVLSSSLWSEPKAKRKNSESKAFFFGKDGKKRKGRREASEQIFEPILEKKRKNMTVNKTPIFQSTLQKKKLLASPNDGIAVKKKTPLIFPFGQHQKQKEKLLATRVAMKGRTSLHKIFFNQTTLMPSLFFRPYLWSGPKVRREFSPLSLPVRREDREVVTSRTSLNSKSLKNNQFWELKTSYYGESDYDTDFFLDRKNVKKLWLKKIKALKIQIKSNLLYEGGVGPSRTNPFGLNLEIISIVPSLPNKKKSFAVKKLDSLKKFEILGNLIKKKNYDLKNLMVENRSTDLAIDAVFMPVNKVNYIIEINTTLGRAIPPKNSRNELLVVNHPFGLSASDQTPFRTALVLKEKLTTPKIQIFFNSFLFDNHLNNSSIFLPHLQSYLNPKKRISKTSITIKPPTNKKQKKKTFFYRDSIKHKGQRKILSLMYQYNLFFFLLLFSNNYNRNERKGINSLFRLRNTLKKGVKKRGSLVAFGPDQREGRPLKKTHTNSSINNTPVSNNIKSFFIRNNKLKKTIHKKLNPRTERGTLFNLFKMGELNPTLTQNKNLNKILINCFSNPFFLQFQKSKKKIGSISSDLGQKKRNLGEKSYSSLRPSPHKIQRVFFKNRKRGTLTSRSVLPFGFSVSPKEDQRQKEEGIVAFGPDQREGRPQKKTHTKKEQSTGKKIKKPLFKKDSFAPSLERLTETPLKEITSLKNNIIIEIWTNGSIHPRQALYDACKNLLSLFSKLEKASFVRSIFKSEKTYNKLSFITKSTRLIDFSFPLLKNKNYKNISQKTTSWKSSYLKIQKPIRMSKYTTLSFRVGPFMGPHTLGGPHKRPHKIPFFFFFYFSQFSPPSYGRIAKKNKNHVLNKRKFIFTFNTDCVYNFRPRLRPYLWPLVFSFSLLPKPKFSELNYSLTPIWGVSFKKNKHFFLTMPKKNQIAVLYPTACKNSKANQVTDSLYRVKEYKDFYLKKKIQKNFSLSVLPTDRKSRAANLGLNNDINLKHCKSIKSKLLIHGTYKNGFYLSKSNRTKLAKQAFHFPFCGYTTSPLITKQPILPPFFIQKKGKFLRRRVFHSEKHRTKDLFLFEDGKASDGGQPKVKIKMPLGNKKEILMKKAIDKIGLFLKQKQINWNIKMSLTDYNILKIQPELVDIGKLNLSLRPYTCLKRANISTLGDLLKKSKEELLMLKNFGKQSLKEVEENLQLLGLFLKLKT